MKTTITTSKNVLLTAIFIIPFACAFAQSKPNKEKYFVMYNGDKNYFTSVSRMTDDSIFCMNDSATCSLLIDSIAEYHYHNHGNAGQGFLIGALTGITLGAIIGAATAPSPTPKIQYLFSVVDDPYQTPGFRAFSGGVLGLLIGGAVGAAIGSSEKKRTGI